MKTSYYAKFSRLPKEEKDRYIPILISTSLPKWFLDREEYYMEYKLLAPSSDSVFKLKNNKMSQEDFINAYTDKLKELDLEQILEDLYDYEGITDTEIVLLCYEKSTDFCHRHILREYLNENFNTNITELGVD
jgi:uncharacterized protein YeaO (DUF488 family)